MKKDIDRLMRENELDALMIIGPADHNPFMYYFTGGHHISSADLIKMTGKKPSPLLFPDGTRRSSGDRIEDHQLFPI